MELTRYWLVDPAHFQGSDAPQEVVLASNAEKALAEKDATIDALKEVQQSVIDGAMHDLSERVRAAERERDELRRAVFALAVEYDGDYHIEPGVISRKLRALLADLGGEKGEKG